MKKRILAFILIVAMVAALGLNAGAAGTGTINIQNMNDGESYTVYKVFDVEYNETTGDYVYLLPAAYSNFLTYSDDIIVEDPAVDEVMTTYFSTTTIGGKTYVSASFDPNSSQSAVAAQLIKSYLDSKHVTGTECTGTLNNMAYGYYLLASSVGNICALGTLVPASVGGDAMLTLREKNLPGGIGGGGVDKESVPVGDGFDYTITVTSPERGKNFSIHDFSKHIIINKNSVKVTGVDLLYDPSVTFEDEHGFTVVGDECPNAECNMHIRFTTTTELPAGTKIKVTYTATKDGENPSNGATVNITDAEGGNVIKPPMASEPSSFSLWKEDGVTKAMIDGATFIAYKIDDGTKYYAKFNFNGTNTYSFSGWSENESDATPITVGACWIYGLPEGTFYFDEIDAPDGYIKANGPVVIEITETAGEHTVSSVSGGNARFNIDTLYVPNTPGNPLPETGGIGTTVFYVGGGILVLGALVILLMKKRNTAD